MADTSPEKGNEAARAPDDYLAWWISIEVDLRKSLVINAMRDHRAIHSLIRTAFEAGQSRATPPSPSTAPEVDGDPLAGLQRFGMAKLEVGHPNHHIGEFVRLAAVRAALASRPAEVDDEGLPPLPPGAYAWEYSGGIVYDEDEYRQGQRDAVAADRAKVSRAMGLLREARAALETWKDVAPAVSLCADIDKVLAGGDQ